MVTRPNLPGPQFWRKPKTGEWGFEEDEALRPGSGGTAGPTQTASEQLQTLVEAALAGAEQPLLASANIQDTVRNVQQQISGVLATETDPAKIRVLLGASETLASLNVPGRDLEHLLDAALHGRRPETAEMASAPATATQASPGHDAPSDLDTLIGSSPAEQEAARDADVILQVGEMVRSARVARGLTQAELAAQTGMTQPHISEIERGLGRIGPTVVTLRRLLNALGEELVIGSAGSSHSRAARPSPKRPSTRRVQPAS